MEAYKRDDGTVFKLGDKVKITDNTNSSCNPIGTTGFITQIKENECRVSVNNDKRGMGNNTKYDEMELYETPCPKCSKCHQVLPEKTEAEKVAEGLRKAYSAINSGAGKFSCCEIGRQLPKLRPEYEAFIEPLISGSTFKGCFESKRVRLAMITMFAAKKKAELE